MPTEAGHSSEIAPSEYTANSLPADENTPLVREDNLTSRQRRLCEHFNSHHLFLDLFLLFLLAEVVVLIIGLTILFKKYTSGNSTNTPQEILKEHSIDMEVTMSLSVVEIVNCCLFLGIIVKSPSFVGFPKVFKELCCLPNFWTLLLFFILYLIGCSITIHKRDELYMEQCAQDNNLCMTDMGCDVLKLTIVEMILGILSFFTMMILVVFLNHTNLRYTISGSAWLYRMLKGTLVMFCFRLFVPVVFSVTTISIALINGPNGKEDILTAKIINEILLLPFCKKIIELLWQKIFFDEKCIIGKIRRKRGTRQITFVV